MLETHVSTPVEGNFFQDAALEGDRIAQVEASRKELQQEALALEQLAELRRLNRRLMDRAAASDAALAFLKQRETTEGAFDEADEEEEKMQIRAFKAQRELASDPGASCDSLIKKVDGQGHPLPQSAAASSQRLGFCLLAPASVQSLQRKKSL